MQVLLSDTWGQLSEEARIWIWASPRPLESEEQAYILERLGGFVSKWTSHQVALTAGVNICYDHFVIVALDEKVSTGASGCSIDALTHEVQAISDHVGVNLQDRQTFFFLKDNEISPIHMNEVATAHSGGDISPSSLVIDTLVKTKKDLSGPWIKPASESWHARFL